MEGFCRGCLIKYDDPMELLHYTEKNRRLFVYSTGIQVKRNDTLTFQLCKDCFLNMKQACKFKKQCRTSDKRFKNFLGLKDIGDSVDFCTFLKNSEEALTFRLPLISGSSTPANQKCRDDDNESTCTSIRNFMTDILEGEEVPDTEARIIREVIEEEADVLDDSLDSHWLQDDMSLDTDFRLDFSFSPFSTPRSVNNEGYTPKRLTDEREERLNYYESKAIENQNKTISDITDVIYKHNAEKEFCDYNEEINEIDNLESLDQNIETLENNIECLTSNIADIPDTNDFEIPIETNVKKEIINPQNFYVPQAFDNDVQNNVIGSSNLIDSLDNEKSCSIDRKLEEALKDETNKEISLDSLLVSSPVFPNVSAASTPTITNILFGEKLDVSDSNSNHKIGQCIENYRDVEGDIEIFEEFFQNDTKELELKNETKDHDEVDNRNIKSMTSDKENYIEKDKISKHKLEDTVKVKLKVEEIAPEDQFDLEKCSCNLCKKTFKNAKALSIHFTKMHNAKIVRAIKQPHRYRDTPQTCNICGKSFEFRSGFSRHMKSHKNYNVEKSKGISYNCDKCGLNFKSQKYMQLHKRVHTGVYHKDETKTYLCNICGATSTSSSNHRLHLKRHTKDYTVICKVCGKGFYRTTDLEVHTRKIHTGETPYPCKFCPRIYARRTDVLRHIRSVHLGEKLYECHHCSEKFVAKNVLRSHLKRAKKCQLIREETEFIIKALQEPITPLADTPTEPEIKEDVTVVYTPGDENCVINQIFNQLPLIDTEMSN